MKYVRIDKGRVDAIRWSGSLDQMHAKQTIDFFKDTGWSFAVPASPFGWQRGNTNIQIYRIRSGVWHTVHPGNWIVIEDGIIGVIDGDRFAAKYVFDDDNQGEDA